MKYRWKKWDFWKTKKDHVEKKMSDEWMKGGNCDSCCPNCKQWESLGNAITTIPNEDGSVSRTCGNCDHNWLAIFTPAGFSPVK